MKETFTGYNPKMLERSRSLRKEMTPEEKHLWFDFLRSYPVHVYKQRSIAEYFIADFYCPRAKLVIEVDGGQHFSEEGRTYDDMRTAIIEQYQIEVIRVTNSDVMKNFEGVCRMIDRCIQERIKQS